MKSISTTELQRDSKKIMDNVTEGEVYKVIRNSKEIACIVPIQSMDQLKGNLLKEVKKDD